MIAWLDPDSCILFIYTSFQIAEPTASRELMFVPHSDVPSCRPSEMEISFDKYPVEYLEISAAQLSILISVQSVLILKMCRIGSAFIDGLTTSSPGKASHDECW